MEAQAALVGADGGVELHAVAAVDLNLAVVVHPGDAEDDNALRLDEALDQAVGLPFGVLIDDELQALENLFDGLQKLRLVAVVLLYVRVYTLQVIILDHSLTSFINFFTLTGRPLRPVIILLPTFPEFNRGNP